MIQFNLLPDAKLAFMKAKRAEHLALTVSSIAIVFSVIILILLFSVVDGLQKKSLSDVNADIQKYGNQVKSVTSLNKILTVQNQLKALPALENQKPVASRLFGYISQITPQQANISKLHIDFSKNVIELTGTADSLSTINKFADTLKFTTYTTGTGSKATAAFTGVVLSSFSRDAQTASYDITAGFAQPIFNVADKVTLTVPSITSTRSATEQPQVLFTEPSSSSTTTTPNTNK